MKKPDNLLSTDHLGPLLNFLPKIFNYSVLFPATAAKAKKAGSLELQKAIFFLTFA